MIRDILEFSPEKEASSFHQTRQWEKENLKRKISQAEKWKKRLQVLEDSTVDKLVTERLKKLQEECTKHGIKFNSQKKTVASYGFGSRHTTSYIKDDVKIEGLYSSLTINPDGSVCMDVYKVPEEAKKQYYFRPTAADKVIRIFVSDNVRVTNNILRTLIKKI